MKTTTAISILALMLAIATPAHGQGWPDVFDPDVLLTLNLDMDESDWTTIQNDDTLDIEVPALFWADGDVPILVSVRRKSADPLNMAAGFSKVGLKLDINEYVTGQLWRDLRKVSLENGDDRDVVAEGLAWQMHRLASGAEGYGYPAGHGCWVRVIINGVDTGVYVNAEQRDKRFLQNRGVWVEGFTWLYEQNGFGPPFLDQGTGPSAALTALCFSPFQTIGPCPPPPDVPAFMAQHIDVQAMITMGVVDTFINNTDHLYNNGKNCYFADYSVGVRQYFPWDLDNVFGLNVPGVYPIASPYADLINNEPSLRAMYTSIMNDLLCGPMSEQAIHDFLDETEILLTPALQADVNSQIPNVAVRFDELRQFVTDRIAQAQQDLDVFTPCGCVGDTDGNLAVDIDDIVNIILDFGTDGTANGGDVDGSGLVDIDDVILAVLNFGACPGA